MNFTRDFNVETYVFYFAFQFPFLVFEICLFDRLEATSVLKCFTKYVMESTGTFIQIVFI